MAIYEPVKLYYEPLPLISGSPHFFKVILAVVIFIYHADKTYCATLITGQNVTLSCSLPSPMEAVEWTDKTGAKFSNTLSSCEAGTQKCDKNQRYERGDLHHLAMRNATYSWITVSSDTPGNYTITCNSGDDNVLQTFIVLQIFILTFIDANMFQNPRCDVFPYENDTSKVKFSCKIDGNTNPGIDAELEIIGAGESIAESPDQVYNIVDYNQFIDVSNVMCRYGIPSINKSCAFPYGIRINNRTDGDDAVFLIEANFGINDLVIDWELMKIDNIVVDTTNYTLWYDNKKTSMLFRKISSRTDTEGIIVKCQITRNDENQNVSTVVGVGFISLKSYKI